MTIVFQNNTKNNVPLTGNRFTGKSVLNGYTFKPATRTTAAPVDTTGQTNASILKGLGIDLDTVLTPKNKRKKTAGLQGGDPVELAALLGE